MSELENNHKLIILFDRNQTSFFELNDFLSKNISKDIETHIGLTDDNDLEITIEGSIQEVDKCHIVIKKILFEKNNLNFYLIKDTVGDKIRSDLFLRLSIVEQELRFFVNKCMKNVFGFKWLSQLEDLAIPGSDRVQNQKNLHILELITLNELINLINFEKTIINEDDPIKIKDLIKILNQSKTIDDFREKLESKTKKFSLWEIVFSKFLQTSLDEWVSLVNNDLKFVIQLRNDVMHHKQVFLSQIDALDKKIKNIREVIISAEIHLSEEQRNEILGSSKEIRDIFSEFLLDYSETDTYFKIYYGIDKAKTDSNLQIIRNEIETFHSSGIIDKKQYIDLKRNAFEKLIKIIGTDITRSKPVIFDELLPICLDLDKDYSYYPHGFRELLVRWIEQYDSEDFIFLVDSLISTLLSFVESSKSKPALYTLSELGYKRKDILDNLWGFVKSSDNEEGDSALLTLTNLGLSPNESQEILAEIHKRSIRRFNQMLVFSLYRIGNRESIKHIVDNWILNKNLGSKKLDNGYAFTAIRGILEKDEINIRSHTEIWNKIVKIVENNPKSLYWDLDVGNVSNACNSEKVIPTILSWIGDNPEWFEKPYWALYLAEERLKKCKKPKQIKGWSKVNNENVIKLIKTYCCLDTENDLFAPTQESMLKDNAWNLILRIGNNEFLNWFDEAVVEESGRFVRQKVMNFFACFKLEQLPGKVVEWIEDVYDDSNSTDGREMAYRIAATRIAHSSASVEAFNSLLNFGFTRKGNVLDKSAEALSEVSICLLRKHDYSIFEILIQKISIDNPSWQRESAIITIKDISSIPDFQNLFTCHHETLLEAIFEGTRSDFERGQLLLAVSNLVDLIIPQNVLPELINLSHYDNKWLSFGSLMILARKNFFETNPDLLKSLLQIANDEINQFTIIGKIQKDWIIDIICVLYDQNPKDYSQIIIKILNDFEWGYAAKILPYIQKNNLYSESISSALVERINNFSPYYVESSIINFLEEFSPHDLIIKIDVKQITNWMPEGRVAIADTLGRIDINSNRHKCLLILEKLTEDEYYPIRRSSYRSIMKQDPQYLMSLCQTWISSPILSLNIRAAEALSWIECSIHKELKTEYDKLEAKFIYNQIRKVREIAKNSIAERNERLWANEYLGKILSIKGKNNQEILKNWAYGDALALTGDDEILYLLNKHLVSNKLLPPNVKYWIYRIEKQLSENWRKTTSKWKNPILNTSGALKKFSGYFHNFQDPSVKVEITIWHTPSTLNTSKSSWGGIMIIPSLAEFFDLPPGEIELEDGRKGKIVLTNLYQNYVVFQGNGPFPNYENQVEK